MKTELPPLHWVKSFEAAARLVNFSAAARELNITQPAVSQHISLLESHLGQALFIRQPRRLTLSAHGRAYLPVVQTTLHNLQRKTADIFFPHTKQRLLIRVNYAFSSLWLSSNLASFCAQYPEVELQIEHANWEQELFDGDYDLAIINGNGHWPAVSAEPLIRPRVQPYCSAQLAPMISAPHDLLATALIDIAGTGHSWSQWFSQFGIDWREHGVQHHQVDTLLSATLMVESGLGAMLGFCDLFATQPFKRPLLAPLPLGMDTDDNYFLVCALHTPLSPAAEAFRQWLLEAMRGLRQRA